MFQHVCFNHLPYKHAIIQENVPLFGGVLRNSHPWFFCCPIMAKGAILAMIHGQNGGFGHDGTTKKSRVRTPPNNDRNIPFHALFQIDQNWSRCSCISSACRFCPENMKKPSKSAFFRFFDYKIFISYQDGPKCTKWPTWPLEVCGDRRAYVVLISNTLSLRQLTFKSSCSPKFLK